MRREGVGKPKFRGGSPPGENRYAPFIRTASLKFIMLQNWAYTAFGTVSSSRAVTKAYL